GGMQMRQRFLLLAGALLLNAAGVAALAQAPATSPPPAGGRPTGPTNDIELVERLLAARRDYQASLEQLRAYYRTAGDVERARWAEEELLQYHRIAKQAYRLEMDVPVPTLQAQHNI